MGLKVQVVAFALLSILLIQCTKKSTDTTTAAPTPGAVPTQPFVLTNGKCEKALDAIPAFDEATPMFPKIHAFYKDYAQCLDAGIATGMQSVVVNTLNKKWSELPTLAELSSKDAKFKDFVLNNMNDAVSEMTLEVSAIVTHAKNKCPAGQESLCSEIKKSAEAALAKDIESSEELSTSSPPPDL